MMKTAALCASLIALAACVPETRDNAANYLLEDGYYISVHPEGSAAVKTGLRLMDPWWSVDCRPDKMTDRRKCSIWSFYGRAKVYYGASGSPQQVCIVGHDFPGRRGMIRIDQNQAIATDVNGCVGAARVITQMRTGSSITVRFYGWPYDYPKDETHTLAGFEKAMDVVQRLRNGTIAVTPQG